MRWLTAPIQVLWGIARRSWVSIDPDLRPRSGASALKLFLFLIFLVIGIVLRLLGFGLADVDRWLDAQGGWLNALGSIVFRGLCGAVLLVCVLLVGAGIVQMLARLGGRSRRSPRSQSRQQHGNAEEATGIGCVATGTAAVIGYFAWFGMMY